MKSRLNPTTFIAVSQVSIPLKSKTDSEQVENYMKIILSIHPSIFLHPYPI